MTYETPSKVGANHSLKRISIVYWYIVYLLYIRCTSVYRYIIYLLFFLIVISLSLFLYIHTHTKTHILTYTRVHSQTYTYFRLLFHACTEFNQSWEDWYAGVKHHHSAPGNLFPVLFLGEKVRQTCAPPWVSFYYTRCLVNVATSTYFRAPGFLYRILNCWGSVNLKLFAILVPCLRGWRRYLKYHVVPSNFGGFIADILAFTLKKRGTALVAPFSSSSVAASQSSSPSAARYSQVISPIWRIVTATVKDYNQHDIEQKWLILYRKAGQTHLNYIIFHLHVTIQLVSGDYPRGK